MQKTFGIYDLCPYDGNLNFWIFFKELLWFGIWGVQKGFNFLPFLDFLERTFVVWNLGPKGFQFSSISGYLLKNSSGLDQSFKTNWKKTKSLKKFSKKITEKNGQKFTEKNHWKKITGKKITEKKSLKKNHWKKSLKKNH